MGTFLSLTGETVPWEYVVHFSNLQNEHGLHFTNKLSVSRIQ